ncbi:MAG: polysaccharide deacetylase family protein [Clostridia bacterium]|nr:polysaccharide deacetylase family protein [Clostridia bacterium]
MKKFSLVMVFIIITQCFLCITAGYTENSKTILYSVDGRYLLVEHDVVDDYCSVGWYTEPVTTVYTPDYRCLIIKKSEIDVYKNVGWYEYPVMTVYSVQGKQNIIKISDLDAYKSVGWYEEPVTLMYSIDNRTLVVKMSELEDYKAVGWYTEPVMSVYARDGRMLIIACSSLDDYKKVGWYDDISAISAIMISPSQKEETVFADHYAAYYNMGYRFKGSEYIDPSKPMIALTFDDGPSAYTPQILDCLTQYGARATFFCVGQNVKLYPQTVKRAFELGMEIGNHTYNHPDLVKASDSSVSYQLNSTKNAIYDASGIYPEVMRPPYGSIDSRVRSLSGYPVILWSVDTLDWKTRNANSTYNSIISKVKDGDIILMHDLYSQTAAAVKLVVPKLYEAGYQMVSVSELAKYKGINLQNGVSYSSIR